MTTSRASQTPQNRWKIDQPPTFRPAIGPQLQSLMIDSATCFHALSRATDDGFASSVETSQQTAFSQAKRTPRGTKLAASVLVGFFSLVMTACSSIRPPIVTVESIAANPDAPQTSYVELVAENPNDKELPILSIQYAVTSAGQTYSGTREGQETLSRFGQRRLRLPLVMTVPAGQQVEVRGTLEYLKPSTIARTLQENGAGGSTIDFASVATAK